MHILPKILGNRIGRPRREPHWYLFSENRRRSSKFAFIEQKPYHDGCQVLCLIHEPIGPDYRIKKSPKIAVVGCGRNGENLAAIKKGL